MLKGSEQKQVLEDECGGRKPSEVGMRLCLHGCCGMEDPIEGSTECGFWEAGQFDP